MGQLEKNLYSFNCVKCEEREQKLHDKEANEKNVHVFQLPWIVFVYFLLFIDNLGV